jgi:two-component system sensor histidine kinase AlgZ
MELEKLGLVSLYVQWVGLSAVAGMCVFRNRINKLSEVKRVFSTSLIFFICFIAVDLIAQNIGQLHNTLSINWYEFSRRGLIALICFGVTIRLFSLLDVLDQRSQAESQSRVLALQSRIRPHFLFNSLNTIAELVASKSDYSERAISSLALLFRVSLENTNKFHSISAEIDLCKRYLELERWRMGERLTVNWEVGLEQAEEWQVPKLILQPLIENAIVHGVQESGLVEINASIKENNKYLSIMIDNPSGATAEQRQKNGMAIDNIRERLIVLYDDQQSFKVSTQNGRYKVLMRVPKSVVKG